MKSLKPYSPVSFPEGDTGGPRALQATGWKIASSPIGEVQHIVVRLVLGVKGSRATLADLPRQPAPQILGVELYIMNYPAERDSSIERRNVARKSFSRVEEDIRPVVVGVGGNGRNLREVHSARTVC